MLTEHLDTILTALIERRNRLIAVGQRDGTHPNIRQRIQECNAAIRAVKSNAPPVLHNEFRDDL